MSHLTNKESKGCVDAFFTTLIGDVNFDRWKRTKLLVKMESEMQFVEWLLDVAAHTLLDTSGHSAEVGGEEEEMEGETEPPETKPDMTEYYTCGEPEDTRETTDERTGGQSNNAEPKSPSQPRDDGRQQPVDAELLFGALDELTVMSRKVIRSRLLAEHNQPVSDPSVVGGLKPDEVIGEDGKILYKCMYCAQTFTFRSAIPRHMKSRHFLSKTHSCQYCQRTFTRKDTLKNHERTHLRIELAGQDGMATSEEGGGGLVGGLQLPAAAAAPLYLPGLHLPPADEDGAPGAEPGAELGEAAVMAPGMAAPAAGSEEEIGVPLPPPALAFPAGGSMSGDGPPQMIETVAAEAGENGLDPAAGEPSASHMASVSQYMRVQQGVVGGAEPREQV